MKFQLGWEINDSKLKKIAEVLLKLAFFLVNYFLHLP